MLYPLLALERIRDFLTGLKMCLFLLVFAFLVACCGLCSLKNVNMRPKIFFLPEAKNPRHILI
jgi:hypothetical protein